MSDAKLFDQCGVVTKQVCSDLRTYERRDWVGLTGKNEREPDNRGGSERRTVFPITRTGFFTLERSRGARRSTERTGHPKL